MNFYYDIILNWNDEKNYSFYEWMPTDPLELIKKIPFVRIKHKSLLEIMDNNIKVSKEFLTTIKDKTSVACKRDNKITYACLFSDAKYVIALEFNEEGISISRSNLLIEDEINVLDIAYDLKETNLYYELLSPIPHDNTLRQEREAKKLIKLELDNLYENKDISKLKYLYYEYSKLKEDNIDNIYHNLTKALEQNFNSNILKLYYVIKLSYHNV